MEIPYKECSQEEIDDLEDSEDDLIAIEYDLGPMDAADMFAAYLIEQGYKVVIHANDDIPTLYYKIVPPKVDQVEDCHIEAKDLD